MFQHRFKYQVEKEQSSSTTTPSNRYQLNSESDHLHRYNKYEPPVDYSEEDDEQQNSIFAHSTEGSTSSTRRTNYRILDDGDFDDCDDGDEDNDDLHSTSSSVQSQPTLPVINFRQLTFERLLGQGGFGKVYRARYDAHLVAIKEPIYFDSGRAAAVNKAITEEARLHYHLSHPNIIRLYGISIASHSSSNSSSHTKVLLVMEYAQGGSLRELISRDRHGRILPPNVIIRFATQIASAVEYLHSIRPRAIVHRDLKSPNILLNESLNNNSHSHNHSNWQLKLTDLGLAAEFTHSTKMSQCGGTYAWMAPECITESTFSKASDVWSFAVVLWELLTGQIPYRDFSGPAIAFGVGNGRLSLPIPATCPEELRAILEACWNRSPKHRPSFSEIRAQLEASSFSNVVQGAAFEKMKRRWFSEVEAIWGSLKEKELELEDREEEARRKEAETRRKEAEVERLKWVLKQQSEQLRRREIEVVSRELNVLLQQQLGDDKVEARPERRKKKVKSRTSLLNNSGSRTKIGYPQNFCHNLTVTTGLDVSFLQARAINKTWGPGTKVRPQLNLGLFSGASQSASSSKCEDLDQEEGNSGEGSRKSTKKVKKIGSFLRRIFGSSKSNLSHKRNPTSRKEDDNEDGDGGDDDDFPGGDGHTVDNEDYEVEYEDSGDDSTSQHQNMLSTTALLSRTYHGQTKHSERKRLNLYEHFTQYVDHHYQNDDENEDESGSDEEENNVTEEECSPLPTQIPLKYHNQQQYYHQYDKPPPARVFKEEERPLARSPLRRSLRTRTGQENFDHHDLNNNDQQMYYNQSSSSGGSSSNSKSTTASLLSKTSEHFDEDLLQEFNRFEREFQSMNCPSG